MAKPSKTTKLVVTSMIISIAVLVVFVLVFMNAIVPAYEMTQSEIYSALTKIFPILLGLLLIQIGIMIAKKEDSLEDAAPKEPEIQIVEKPVEVIKEVPVEVIKEVPVEVVKTVEVPVEVIKEVPVEVVKTVEVPVEVVKTVEVPVEVTKTVEVPVEVIREVQVPVEVIKEVEVEKEPEPVFLDFHQTLEAEAEDAAKFGYNLSVVAVKADGISEEAVEAALEEDSLVFTENGLIYTILPLYNRAEAESAMADFSIINIASLDGRSVSASELIAEASRA